MSKILVDTIDTRSGTTTLTLGSSNAGTIALGSGDVQSNFLQPMFEATVSATTTVSANTLTKVVFNTEVIDTDSAYDNSSNYRFTVPSGKAGKYVFYSQVLANTNGNNTFKLGNLHLYKNGSSILNWQHNPAASYGHNFTVAANKIVDMSVGDYVEVYILVDDTGGTAKYEGGTYTTFGGYRIGT
jgi:hypothetical protein